MTTSAALFSMTGKIGQYLRENDWLMSIKQRTGIPGGACEFDLPSYHYWLHRPAEERTGQLAAWTGPLYSTSNFVVRVMCVDPERELQDAYAALARASFPPEATAVFDDVSALDYATVAGPLRTALQSPDQMDEARWSIRLVRGFREQYRRVTALARAGR